MLFVLIIGIIPTERRVQQYMHQVNPTLVGSSYPGSVLASKTSTHYILGEVPALPSLMIGWVLIILLWSGEVEMLYYYALSRKWTVVAFESWLA